VTPAADRLVPGDGFAHPVQTTGQVREIHSLGMYKDRGCR
jgi:hypothetical protein